MLLKKLELNNSLAVSKTREFRMRSSPDGMIDSNFHHYKNNFPYYGYVDVKCHESNFLMLSNNDDIVAMTYFWFGDDSYEKLSTKLWALCSSRSRVVYDVGSYTGLYSFIAASVSANSVIHAIEPSRRTFGRLISNIYVNALVDRVVPHCVAISNERGYLNFNEFRGLNILGCGDSLKIKEHVEVARNDEVVHVITLDDFSKDVGALPDLIKIDVEESEFDVIKFSEGVLIKRPIVVVEVTKNSYLSLIDFLSTYDYIYYFINDSSVSLSTLPEKEINVFNMIFIHKSDDRFEVISNYLP